MSLAEDIGNGPGDLRWWDEPEEKRHDAIWDCVQRIDRAQEYRKLNDLLHASLFGNVEQTGLTPKSWGRPTARAHARLSLNVVRNMICAVGSKIAAKNKVHPKFLTNDGDASLQRKAKKREQLVAGIFYDQKFYRKQRLVFQDIGIFGTGFIRPWVDKETRTVTLERIPKSDVLVDDEEAHYGDPPCLYHRKWYDKRVLAKMFPGKEDIIRDAGRHKSDRGMELETHTDATADIIPVVEAFHRPSTATAGDGLRVLALDSGVLGSAPWEYDYFPFPKLVWSEEPYGFFGTGLAYELAGIQAEINDILLEFARAHRLLKGAWLVDRSSKVVLKHINDDLGKIVQYAGLAPTYYQPAAIPQDTYRYLWDLYAKAFEIAGISQLQASGMKPAGLNSGEAQRVYDDIQTERFLSVGMALEDWTLDVTEQVLDRAGELAKEEGGYKVKSKTDRGLETIDFKEADLPKDSHIIQVFPTSMLPNTPSGRLAFINDMMDAKLVSNPGDAMKLLGFPDVEAFMTRENAPRELLDRNIESILDEGKWVSPEPLDDHDLALAEVPKAIARARVRGVPRERLTLARRYIVLSVRLKKLAATPDGMSDAITSGDPDAAPPPPPPPGPGGPPPPAGPPPPIQQAA